MIIFNTVSTELILLKWCTDNITAPFKSLLNVISHQLIYFWGQQRWKICRKLNSFFLRVHLFENSNNKKQKLCQPCEYFPDDYDNFYWKVYIKWVTLFMPNYYLYQSIQIINNKKYFIMALLIFNRYFILMIQRATLFETNMAFC